MATVPLPFPSVYDGFLAAARLYWDKTAIIYEGERISYKELSSHIDNTVCHLRALGVGAGDTFAVYGQNHPEHFYCYYAASKMGAVLVSVNPNLTAAEIEFTVKHSEAKVVFYDETVAESAMAAVPPKSLLPLSVLSSPVAGDAAAVRVDPTDDFLICYSSGTTGAPKAVVLDQAAQVNVAVALARMWGVNDRDTTLVALPLGYLFGISTAGATGIAAGGTVVVLRRFHPRDVLEAIIKHKITVYHGVPTMCSMMLEYCEQRDLHFDLSNVRALICSGAPLPKDMASRFVARFDKELQNYFAMTEVTPVFGRFHDDPRPVPEGAIGRAAPGATVRILRPDGSECATNEAGEGLVRGAATLKRYHKNQALTEASMKDGLFRSGDLVRIDEGGYYYIVGRIKEIIIRGGHNISPAEVEQVLVSHPAVQEAAVVGVPDRIFGEAPVAFVVRRHGADVTQEELVGFVEKQLSDFKVPRTILFYTDLPQGLTGKIDKKILKQHAEEAMSEQPGSKLA
jgi:long-chain acyl-CoA synthetase